MSSYCGAPVFLRQSHNTLLWSIEKSLSMYIAKERNSQGKYNKTFLNVHQIRPQISELDVKSTTTGNQITSFPYFAKQRTWSTTVRVFVSYQRI